MSSAGVAIRESWRPAIGESEMAAAAAGVMAGAHRRPRRSARRGIIAAAALGAGENKLAASRKPAIVAKLAACLSVVMAAWRKASAAENINNRK
jgi:hypothetical protein